MRNIFLFTALLFLMHQSACAQSQNATAVDPLTKNSQFTGATADADGYKAIFQLDTDNPKIIEKTFRNINNTLKDPRLEGKVQIELITFSGGTQALLKANADKYEKKIKDLIQKGVIVAQCENSLTEQNRTKDEFYDFIGYVPSGNGELIIREQQGWTIVKP